MIKIKSVGGDVLFAGDYVCLKDAVNAAVGARANLDGAYLARANLAGAYLAGANLTGAYLTGATGVNKYITTPLFLYLDQPGDMVAYKLVKHNNEGPFQGGIKYKIGQEADVGDANTDETAQCGAGINVATLDWCIRHLEDDYKILVVSFRREDIACIPIASDGKFRLRHCKVIGEKNLEELGCVAK